MFLRDQVDLRKAQIAAIKELIIPLRLSVVDEREEINRYLWKEGHSTIVGDPLWKMGLVSCRQEGAYPLLYNITPWHVRGSIVL